MKSYEPGPGILSFVFIGLKEEAKRSTFDKKNELFFSSFWYTTSLEDFSYGILAPILRSL